MPTDNTKYNRVPNGPIHVDGTGVWVETPKITAPKLSNERWAKIYKWMEEYLIVGQYLNDSYWDEDPKQ